MDQQRALFKKFFNSNKSKTNSGGNTQDSESACGSAFNSTSALTSVSGSGFNPPKFQFNKKKLGVMIKCDESDDNKAKTDRKVMTENVIREEFEFDGEEINSIDIESIDNNVNYNDTSKYVSNENCGNQIQDQTAISKVYRTHFYYYCYHFQTYILIYISIYLFIYL